MLQFSDDVRDAENDAIETVTGAAPLLQFFTLAQPANCAAVDNPSSTMLAEIECPSDFMAASSGGVKELAGLWAVLGIAAGTVAHFRLKNAAGSVCHQQGSVGLSAADMIVDDVVMAIGKAINVTQYTLTQGNG